MVVKLPNWKTTFRFFHRLSAHISFGLIAQKSGKELQTAEAWARPVESDEFPSGSGKRNPFDVVLRLLAMAHEYDPALAHEAAEIFIDYVNFLDEKKREGRGGDCAHEALAKCAKEHADILIALLHSKTPDYQKVWTEIKEAQIALQDLEAVVKAKLKQESAQ